MVQARDSHESRGAQVEKASSEAQGIGEEANQSAVPEPSERRERLLHDTSTNSGGSTAGGQSLTDSSVEGNISSNEIRGGEERRVNSNGFQKVQRKGGKANRSQWVQRDLAGLYERADASGAGIVGPGAFSQIAETQAAELMNP